nr:MFS transporter [Actinomyces oris]
MATSYRTILIHPGARSFTSAGLIARFPMSMVGISTILAVEELYGSYTAAGLVSAANFVAMAIGAPILARCVDRYGQSRVMLPAVLVSSLSLVGLVLAAAMRTHLGVLAALSALAGGLAGSMGSLVRARWTAMLTRPEEVHAAFSLEAALDEVAFILGPVLATALCTTPFLPVTSGWVCCVVMRYGAMVSIAVVFLILGALFGANDVAAVAFATEAGHKSASGLILAVWGVGSFVAALLYGSRTWGWPLWKQLMAGLVGLAVGASTFGFAPSLVVLSVLALLTGLAIAPTLTSGNNIVQVTVAPSQLTEGLAWVSTALNIGVSIGSLLAGQATDAGGSRAGYLAVAAFAWGAVVVGVLGLSALRRARTSGSLGGH